jgi:hypothetical protein
LNKTAAKALGEEKGRAPIHAGSNELQLPRAVGTLVEWHTAAEYTLKKALAEQSPLGGLAADRRPQKSEVCVSPRFEGQFALNSAFRAQLEQF